MVQLLYIVLCELKAGGLLPVCAFPDYFTAVTLRDRMQHRLAFPELLHGKALSLAAEAKQFIVLECPFEDPQADIDEQLRHVAVRAISLKGL